MDFDYQNFTSRNYFYISSNLQSLIHSSGILILGCGLGSVISEIALRSGFVNFTLVDNDKVELSNLNRQSFVSADIGEYKVDALRRRLIGINPEANINAIKSKILSIADLPSGNHDIVINTLDFTRVYFDLINYYQDKLKLILCPLNVGFGGFVMAFNSQSMSISELLGDHTDLSEKKFFDAIMNKCGIKLPKYIAGDYEGLMMEKESVGYDPQLSIGANIVASAVVTLILSYLNNCKIDLMPKVYHLDALDK